MQLSRLIRTVAVATALAVPVLSVAPAHAVGSPAVMSSTGVAFVAPAEPALAGGTLTIVNTNPLSVGKSETYTFQGRVLTAAFGGSVTFPVSPAGTLGVSPVNGSLTLTPAEVAIVAA